jgi:hypothetical protein
MSGVWTLATLTLMKKEPLVEYEARYKYDEPGNIP